MKGLLISFALASLVTLWGSAIGDDLLLSKKSLFKAPEDPQLKTILTNYRQHWKRVTGINPSALHWHQSVITFVQGDDGAYSHNHNTYVKEFNEDYDDESEIVFRKYPIGTKIVKENFLIQTDAPPQPLTVTIMIKREPGYAPKFGDWQYAQVSRDGVTVLKGNGTDPVVNQVCVSCHGEIHNRDFVFATHANTNSGN